MKTRLSALSRSSVFREWLLLCVALLAIGAAIALELFAEHARIETSDRERLTRLGHIVNEALEARLVAIYKTLGAIRTNAMHLKKLDDGKAHSHDLQVLGDALLGVRTLLILDVRGRALASNRPELVGQDFSLRPYFTTAQADNNPTAMYLSAPFTTLLGAYAMQVTRVVVDDRGRFAGIVTATLDPNYFRTLLESLRYADDMQAAIAHGGGIQFLMVPDQPGIAAMDIAQPGSFFTRHFESGAQDNILSGEVLSTGAQRIMALRTVKPEALHMDQKLVVAIGRDVSAMFAGWRKHAYDYLVGYLLAILVSVVSMMVYQRRRKDLLLQQSIHYADLETSETLKQAVLDSVPANIVVLDRSGAIVDTNHAWRTFGQSNGVRTPDWQGINYLDAVRQAMEGNSAGAEEALQGIGSVLSGESPVFTLEYPCHSPETERWFAMTVTPLLRAEGGVVIAHTDITRRRYEEDRMHTLSDELKIHRDHLDHLVTERTAELQATESRLNLLINSTADGILEVSPTGIICMVNAAAAEILDYLPDELIGRNVHDAIHYQHPDGTPYPASECEIMGAIVEGRRLRLESDLLWRSDGSSVPVTLATHPIWHNNGITGAVMSFFDITKRNHADEAREKARVATEALAEANRVLAQQIQSQLAERAETAERLAKVKSEFLANMSHEIRTPLNGVLGLAQIGYRDSLGGSKTQETFARILSSGKLLLTVINDILDFSKIEAGKLSIESVPMDPASLVDEAIHAASQQASAKGLALIPNNAADLPAACLGDPIRISQILLNLLSNAIKFTGEGIIRVGAHRAGNVLVYSVTDTGVGIDAAQIGRLFMPFEQADSSTTRKFGGTGLGLAISRRLADMMGGSLQATSTIGVGTTFELQLPLKESDTITAETPAKFVCGNQKRLAGIRILVAEDTEINRVVLEDFLVSEGATVEMVENGRLAVEAVKLRSKDFDAVLADIQMPEMDGVEATLQIRKLAPHLPVIGQTAHALREELDRCLNAGMVATITKPIDIDMLVATVLNHVGPPHHTPVVPPQVFDVSPQPATRTIIDWDTLAKRYPTRPEFIDRLVTLSIQCHENDAEQLRRLVIAGEVSEIAKLAHALKGMAGNINAPEVEKTAISVMHAVRTASAEALNHAHELAGAVEQLIAALKQGRLGLLSTAS